MSRFAGSTVLQTTWLNIFFDFVHLFSHRTPRSFAQLPTNLSTMDSVQSRVRGLYVLNDHSRKWREQGF